MLLLTVTRVCLKKGKSRETASSNVGGVLSSEEQTADAPRAPPLWEAHTPPVKGYRIISPGLHAAILTANVLHDSQNHALSCIQNSPILQLCLNAPNGKIMSPLVKVSQY